MSRFPEPPPAIVSAPAVVFRIGGKGRRYHTRYGAERARALDWMFRVRPCECAEGWIEDGDGEDKPNHSCLHLDFDRPRHFARLARVIRYLRRKDGAS